METTCSNFCLFSIFFCCRIVGPSGAQNINFVESKKIFNIFTFFFKTWIKWLYSLLHTNEYKQLNTWKKKKKIENKCQSLRWDGCTIVHQRRFDNVHRKNSPANSFHHDAEDQNSHDFSHNSSFDLCKNVKVITEWCNKKFTIFVYHVKRFHLGAVVDDGVCGSSNRQHKSIAASVW